jgi:lipoyl-dependent peroxiredoxin
LVSVRGLWLHLFDRYLRAIDSRVRLVSDYRLNRCRSHRVAQYCFPFIKEFDMTDKVLYTAKVHTTGGRDGGASRSDDGRLDIRHALPGSNNEGTNPEQLFAAGWSACFEGAMGLAARKMKVTIPPEMAIDAEVDLCQDDGGYHLQARLNVSLPGLQRDVAQALVDAADQTCPYSKAIRGNVNVAINLL